MQAGMLQAAMLLQRNIDSTVAARIALLPLMNYVKS
jgi:hypothetical protein